MQITHGDDVIVTDALGRDYRTTATSGVEAGPEFAVVWVRRPTSTDPEETMPWPAEAVRLAGPVRPREPEV